MKPSLIFLLLCAVLALPRPALAQEADRPAYFSISDAKAAIERALTALPRVKCGKEACAPATPEEFASPPVDQDDARIALVTGAKSALLRWCGLEWEERAFPAMFLEFQQKGIHNVRALAILRLIHAEQFAKDYGNLQVLKTCTNETKAKLDAQNPRIELPPWQQIVNNALLDSSVATILQRVLGEIQNAHCGSEPCAPVTEEEKAKPPLTIEEARRAMKVGLLSGVAEFCGLAWKERIFYPFMAHHHRTLNMSPRQLAIISALHATMQGFIVESYKKRGQPCTDELRKNLERHLPSG
jgi:hypothetical protein